MQRSIEVDPEELEDDVFEDNEESDNFQTPKDFVNQLQQKLLGLPINFDDETSPPRHSNNSETDNELSSVPKTSSGNFFYF